MASDPSAAFPLFELPGPCLQAVVLGLWRDTKDVAALCCCSKATEQLCSDQGIWKELLQRRHGKAALPAEAPAAGSHYGQPVSLEGWTFVQGLDAPAEGDVAVEGAESAQQLAQACINAGGQAFTTGGKVITSLSSSPETWPRSSYKPQEGMYVRNDTPAALDLQQQQQQQQQPTGTAEAPSWPPTVQGWVYFPSCSSVGYVLQNPADSMKSHKTLQGLLAASLRDTRVAAVTTNGHTLSRVMPQAGWVIKPSYDDGMYVKQGVVDAMGLQLPKAVPDYRALAARMQRLRCTAAELDGAWINDHYLSKKVVGQAGPPGCDGVVLELNNVWWLDISGDIQGVPPGTYEVVWLVRKRVFSHHDINTYNLSAAATPQKDAPSAETPTPTSGSRSGSSTGSSSRGVQGGETASAAPPPAAADGGGAGLGGWLHQLAANLSNVLGVVAGGSDGAAAGSNDGAAAGSSSAAAAASNGGAAAGSSVSVEYSDRGLRRSMRFTPGGGATADSEGWCKLSGGVIKVARVSTVHCRFWSHDNWKEGWDWAYVELRPRVDGRQQQQQQGRVRRRW